MAGQGGEDTVVAGPQPEDIGLLGNVGRRGFITTILPELAHHGICVKWTRFSLVQMCSFELQWDKEMILTYYYLSTYYADLKKITCPVNVDLQPCYPSNNLLQGSDGRYNGDCNVVTIFRLDYHRVQHHILFKIYHARKEGVIYDSLAHRKSKVHPKAKKKILDYLTKNKFVRNLCQLKEIKWPTEKFMHSRNSQFPSNIN